MSIQGHGHIPYEEIDMKKFEPKTVQELEKRYKAKKDIASPYTLVLQFLKSNKENAYKVSQLQEKLNMASNNDYWSVQHACKFLVMDGLVKSFGSNPTWYAWKGA